jgi:hypothetical protein
VGRDVEAMTQASCETSCADNRRYFRKSIN